MRQRLLSTEPGWARGGDYLEEIVQDSGNVPAVVEMDFPSARRRACQQNALAIVHILQLVLVEAALDADPCTDGMGSQRRGVHGAG